MSSDDNGQMMLLAAIVLIVAFLSLTTLVARISIIEQETVRDVSPAVLSEMDAVSTAVHILDVTNRTGSNLTTLATFEAQRGFLLQASCSGSAGASMVAAVLSDGSSRVSLQIAVADCS